VAQFPEYRRKIIDHVYGVKLHHWDEAIRQLASEALHALTPLDPEYIVAVVLPYLLLASQDPKDIPVRHGAILGLAECVLALGGREQVIKEHVSTNRMNEIAEIVPTIEKKRLYRGRGGEIVRGAVCRLIQCICAARIPLLARQQVSVFSTLSNNLKQLF
jgi:tubulin-specific chaperone D